MTNEENYLKILGIQKEPPSVSFLSQIVKSHLAKIPYENISKIIRFQKHGPSIPSLEEFLDGVKEKTYGGTCFAQNIYLNHILNSLGFTSELISILKDGVISHVSLRVRVDGSNYFVDVGLMSSFAGPFRIHPSHTFTNDVGNQRFIFSPKSDLQNYNLQIWRAGKLIREFDPSPSAFSEQDLQIGIQKTFEPSAMFMNTLCVHRAYEKHSLGIWDRNFYHIKGTEQSVRQIQCYDELKLIFSDELDLPRYPLELILNLLQANGATKLFEG